MKKLIQKIKESKVLGIIAGVIFAITSLITYLFFKEKIQGGQPKPFIAGNQIAVKDNQDNTIDVIEIPENVDPYDVVSAQKNNNKTEPIVKVTGANHEITDRKNIQNDNISSGNTSAYDKFISSK